MPRRNKYVKRLNKKSKQIGGKARGLQILQDLRMNIPETFVCNIHAYEKWMHQKEETINVIRNEIKNVINDKRYIIRSSAKLEDSTNHSFAGQFKTVASVKGVEEIIQAIVEVWNSASQENIENYSKRKGIDRETGMAVIVQELIEPEFSGVVFTRNPLNGIEEVIIETIHGSSDQILQKGMDPERWVFRWENFIERPKQTSIDEKILSYVVKTSKNIEEKIGYPVDLEWIYSKNRVWWIQLRGITSIDQQNYYSNRLSSGHLPGLIKPLVWSINIPLVCGSWIRLLQEMIGDVNIKPEDMAKQFYFRAYYNMSVLGKEFEKIGIPRDSLEILMEGSRKGTIKPKPPLTQIPRLVWFAFEKSFFENKLKKHLQKSDQFITNYHKKNVNNYHDAIIMIEEVFQFNSDASYYVILSQLLHSIFHMILSRRIQKRGENIEMYSLEKLLPEINPHHLIKSLIESLEGTQIDSITLEDIMRHEKTRETYEEIIEKFGHLRESGNDFSKETWRENPKHILAILRDPKIIKIQSSTTNLRLRGWLPRKVASLFELREKISFNYTKTYGYFRDNFLLIGTELVQDGLLEDETDIFYLTYEEIKKLSNKRIKNFSIKKVNKRKNEFQLAGAFKPPSEIYGETPPPIIHDQREVLELKGIPASNGYYKGKIRHVKSINDFDYVKTGDVLVIPYSDLSWLPILSKAGAIISESGGILCHAAVIAREYKIPAVLAAKNAFSLPSESEALVNGYNGTVKIVKS